MASGEIIKKATATTTTTIQFKSFDIVSDDSDHHYISSNKSSKDKDCFTNENGSVHKMIMKEWKILESHLPESIYVQVYEGRIDLLRAAIIGASGTPYHDGLFFFDIAFPFNYPNQPPMVYYHSHGLRLNPNLYESGYVCLSLINTWHGDEKEIWRPSESTILQLLVSLQGLVLNEEPYFNEPGSDEEENEQSQESLAYNEETFISSCKTMLYTLRNPPKNFENFVAEHFLNRADVILAAIKAYKDGLVVVGRYQNIGSSSLSVNVSPELKADLEKVYLDLEKAFSEISIANSVKEGCREERGKENIG